jgi:transposase-like protein
MVSITNKLLPKIEEWQKRLYHSIYHIVFIDAVNFSMRDNVIGKLAAYTILGINDEGHKEFCPSRLKKMKTAVIGSVFLMN